MPKIAVYCYGDHQMGLGHVYKMASLATELSRQPGDWRLCFLMPAHPEGMAVVAAAGHDIVPLPTGDEERQWRAAEPVLRELAPDVIVVDALHSNEQRSRFFRQHTRKLVVFDDSGPGAHMADIVFNVLYAHPDRLPGQVYDTPSYLYLRPEFALLAARPLRRPDEIKRIILMQGGSDTYGILPQLVAQLDTLPGDFTLVPVAGGSFRHQAELEHAAANARHSVEVHLDEPRLGELMAGCDLAVSGAGVSLYELLAAGVPTITVTQEYKELETAARVAANGTTLDLGCWERLAPGAVAKAAGQLMTDRAERERMIQFGRELVDGRGSERLVAIIAAAACGTITENRVGHADG